MIQLGNNEDKYPEEIEGLPFESLIQQVFYCYQVRIGYQDRVKELKEQDLDEEQLKNKLELVKVSIIITKQIKPFEYFTISCCEIQRVI